MRMFNRSNAIFNVIFLTILLTNVVSSQDNQPQVHDYAAQPSKGLLDTILGYLNDSPNASVRIQRMSSTTESVTGESVEESKIELSNPVYRYPVVVLTDANFTQFASQHEWIYVKFFTDWCPHSAAVIPAWHDVSYRLSSTPIAVAEIQCEVDGSTLCEKFKVKAYPSFKLIRKGEIRQNLIGEIKDASRLVDEAWRVYLRESK
ncbi:protein disulfide-isomerase A4-like [Chironomus tepperi]|uniref:protein disulfide-isomerase A4-like n=1 Tax=Chironomus tepperi TaxID=113505 RepID=UPI00391FA965